MVISPLQGTLVVLLTAFMLNLYLSHILKAMAKQLLHQDQETMR